MDSKRRERVARGTALIASFLGATLAAAPALAVMPSGQSPTDGRLELASGEPTPLARSISYQAPAATRAAWSRFLDKAGGNWRAYFDTRTGVPGRIYGLGIALPGSTMSPAIAEQSARATLAAHIDLLAPGSKLDDFELVSDDLDESMRTVGFFQYHEGLRVLGGQLNFRFKNDRLFMIGSEALPEVSTTPSGAVLDKRRAPVLAAGWIGELNKNITTAGVPSEPMILPLLHQDGTISYREVVELRVDTLRPSGRWSVYLDARSLERVARRQTLMFDSGTLNFNSPVRWPGAGRQDMPAPEVYVTQGATRLTTDLSGGLTWTGNGAFTAGVVGTKVAIINEAGSLVTTPFTLAAGASFSWNVSTDEQADAQLITYIAANHVKAHAKVIAPEMTWLDTDQLPAHVNINDVCNAYSDGETINFFQSGSGGGVNCENTGRIPDVVYHEFGHAFHNHAIIPGVGQFETQLSEGVGDYLCASTTGDHGMGRGFFYTNDPLRDLDEANRERVWPTDIDQDPHETGLIFAGAMWDLRKALVATMGDAAGAAKTDRLYYLLIKRAVDIPSTYAEILAADDDDGNLANGTPNSCAINDAFSRHGLADAQASSFGIGLPSLNGFTITVPVMQQGPACPGSAIQSATAHWQLRSDPTRNGDITLLPGPGGYVGTLPTWGDGTVVQYQVTIKLANGDVRLYPDNPADPFYESYIGPVTNIYCTDFETKDPMTDGWVHSLERGTAANGADDWQWGTPAGTDGSDDPSQAFSGTKVIGNDLGGANFDGKYQTNKTNAITSPDIDVSGFTTVRLQYRRWLSVEDGQYDQATIYSNGTKAWANLATSGGMTSHVDKEWRFQDVDLSSMVSGGKVQVKFEIASDQGLTFGGWNIDDVCVVGTDVVVAKCGDGVVQAGEQCDDGNQDDNDGCKNDCTMGTAAGRCGDGIVQAGEQCDDGNQDDNDGCKNDCTMPGSTAKCGDGVVQAGEECDLGPMNGTGNCTADCKNASTGNPTGGGIPNAKGGGCGCATAGPDGARGESVALLLLVLGFAFGRRRGRR